MKKRIQPTIEKISSPYREKSLLFTVSQTMNIVPGRWIKIKKLSGHYQTIECYTMFIISVKHYKFKTENKIKLTGLSTNGTLYSVSEVSRSHVFLSPLDHMTCTTD